MHRSRACELSQGEPGGVYGSISPLCQAQKRTCDGPQLCFFNTLKTFMLLWGIVLLMKLCMLYDTRWWGRRRSLSAEETEERLEAKVCSLFIIRKCRGNLSPSKQWAAPLTACYFIKFWKLKFKDLLFA